ncbi:hypothetical protein KEM54_006770 [Ascosphaera aggregata]|nr:hypothetical protein KEM54_006770 [Ascosphaera aggregata]
MSPLPSPLPPSRERSRSNTATTQPPATSARDRRSRNRESRELRNMQDVNAPPLHSSGPAKRRSTMNSRDAAYDGLDILRRDDEREREREKERERDREVGKGGRRSKRSRSGEEKDEKPPTSIKRQRTNSLSPLPLSVSVSAAPARSHRGTSASDEDESNHYVYHSRHSSHRSAPVKTTRSISKTQREIHIQQLSDSDIEMVDSPTIMSATQPRGKEAVRDEDESSAAVTTSGKRKREHDETAGTTVKRNMASPPAETAATDATIESGVKGDESKHVPPPPSATSSTNGHTGANGGNSGGGRKSGRPPTRRNGRGRNQYTKDREWKDEFIQGNGHELNGSSGNGNGNAKLEGERPETRARTTAATGALEKPGSSGPESPLPIRGRSAGKNEDGGTEDGGDEAVGVQTGVNAHAIANGHSKPLASRSRPQTKDAQAVSLSGDVSSTSNGAAGTTTSTSGQCAATAGPTSASTGDRPNASASTPAPAPLQTPAVSTPTLPHHSRLSMNDMRRRVAAILEFISRTQLDMAANGERITPPKEKVKENMLLGNDSVSATAGAVGLASAEEAVKEGEVKEKKDIEAGTQEVEFEKLSSFEMMDVLTRGLLKWQQEYGKYGDR